ncbi:hypothetical protein [Alloactinosynnema sp. L-07]|uniref:hypothetical protein n=1 Tax=Alloactinosynnema sp. L-07 TaxID=1653480 RepID=UPI00065F0532|nr:hypothetical protein [Alloactinosynnema sp. L-07]CRK58281.1 hypothetical protein [Alloactinosynnema sp. L-07]
MAEARGSIAGAVFAVAAATLTVVAVFAPLLVAELRIVPDARFLVTVAPWGIAPGSGYRPPEVPMDSRLLILAAVALIAAMVAAVGAALPWSTHRGRRFAAVLGVGASVIVTCMVFATGAQALGWLRTYPAADVSVHWQQGVILLGGAVLTAIISAVCTVNAARAGEVDPA